MNLIRLAHSGISTCLTFVLLTAVAPQSACLASTEWMDQDPVPKKTKLSPIEQLNRKAEPASGVMLKGGVTYCVPRGTPIKLKIASVPTSTFGMRMAQRNLDGDLHPAKLNEVLTAKVAEDIFVDDNKVIPAGTIFHGKVAQIIPPKRVGRPGSLVLSFDQFTTPDGRKFAFHAEANNNRTSTLKSKAKGFGLVMAHGAGGAAVGAIVAYSLFGLENTIAMHGYNVAGGAAAGALLGTAVGLMRKGSQAVLEPGEDLNMEIDTDLLIPAATAPTPKAPSTNFPGLQIKINKTKVKKDGLGGHELFIDMTVLNDTNNRLKSIDLHLEDDNGARYELVAGGGDSDYTDMMFEIEPFSDQHLNLAFAIEYPKMKHTLIWVDQKARTILYKVKLQ